MNKVSRKSWSSFRYAFKGWQTFWNCELNARIHLGIAFAVIIAGIVFRISPTEWIVQLLCIALVIGSEMINTAFELMVDKWCKEIDATAAKVKDITAGAVLLNSFIAAIAGIIIYSPKLYNLVVQVFESA